MRLEGVVVVVGVGGMQLRSFPAPSAEQNSEGRGTLKHTPMQNSNGLVFIWILTHPQI